MAPDHPRSVAGGSGRPLGRRPVDVRAQALRATEVVSSESFDVMQAVAHERLVFGGRLTALRYPERDIVSVAAATYYPRGKPFLPRVQ